MSLTRTTAFRAPLTRRGFIAAAAAVPASLALVLAGCGASSAGTASASSGSAAGSSSSSGALKKVRFATPGQDGTLSVGLGIAQAKGFLAEELEKVGYEPEYAGFAQAGPAINEALASGAIDIAEYGDLPGYGAIAKGVPIKAFALASSVIPFGIYVTNASGIKDVHGLKGKRLIVPFGTVPHRYLLKVLADNDLKPTDLNLINAAYDGLSIITSGQADAAAFPLESIYAGFDMSKGKVMVTSYEKDDYSSTFPVFYRTAFHKENPEVAPAITRSLERAFEFATSDRAGAVQSLVTKSVSQDTIEKTYPNGFGTFDPRITDSVESKIEDLGTFMVDNKLASKTISLDEFFDYDVTKQVLG